MPLIGSIKEGDSLGSGTDLGLTGSIIIAERPDASFPSMPGSDTKFFVSGTISARTSVDAATATFGGDVHISGSLSNEYGAALDSLYVGSYDELFISGSSNNDVVFKSTTSDKDMIFRVNDGGVDTTMLKFNADVPSMIINPDSLDLDFIVRSPDETLAIYLNAENEVLHINHGESGFKTKIHCTNGEAITVDHSGITLNEDGNDAIDFRVESDTNDYMFFVDAGNDLVTVGKSTAPGTDTKFFVSGTIQSEFAATPSRAVFGGDLVTSGTVRLALNNTNNADLDSVGSDVNVFVSGSGYSKGTQYANGVALFGGDVVISGSLSAKQKHIASHKYSESSTSQQYIRFNAAGSDSSPGSNNKFVAPYDGQLIKVIARSTTAMDSTVIASHQGENGDTNLQTAIIESATVDMSSANTSYEFTFSNSYFSQGYILGISVNPTTGPNSCDLVSVWEFDTYK